MQRNHDFRRIKFGYASAQTESARDPELLKAGFIDIQDITKKALYGHEFLFLGYKGSGKSAIAQRVELLLQDNPHFFIRNVSLQDFQYSSFSAISEPSSGSELKYPTGWGAIICAYFVASICSDADCMKNADENLISLFKVFRYMGLIEEARLDNVLSKLCDNKFSVGLSELFSYSTDGSDPSRTWEFLRRALEFMRNSIRDSKLTNNHIVIIDGLDDILSSSAIQYKSISALIYEAEALNNFFTKHDVKCKLIVLCRTDIFELVGGPNSNKQRQDSGVELSWFSDPKSPERSKLFSIANTRAELSLGHKINILDFFPKKIRGKASASELLSMTRHTPRDLLQLMKYIQESSSDRIPENSEIVNGMRSYSQKYFLPEIVNEMEGYCAPAELTAIFQCFSHFKARDINVRKLRDYLVSTGSDVSETKFNVIIRALFECSAIGNVAEIERRGGKFQMLTYKYRNRHLSFNPDQRIILHKGLWKALNIPDTSSLFDPA